MLITVPYIAFDRAALPETVRDARRRISAFAADHGATPLLVADVALAVTEALTNVVRHAYPAGRAGLVRLEADVEEDDLEIVIIDDGAGFRSGSSPGLGAGLSIVAETAHDFVIRERDPHGVELWMRFRLNEGVPGAD